jgi:hypothetical protein
MYRTLTYSICFMLLPVEECKINWVKSQRD